MEPKINNWNEINVKMISTGNTVEINRLYDYTRSHLMHMCFQDEELFNDVIMKVVKYSDQYDPKKGVFANWILRITDRSIIDYHRKNKHIRKGISVEEVYENLFVEKNLIVQEEISQQNVDNYYKEQYEKALNLLSERQRQVLDVYLKDNTKKTLSERVAFNRIREKLNRLMEKPDL